MSMIDNPEIPDLPGHERQRAGPRLTASRRLPMLSSEHRHIIRFLTVFASMAGVRAVRIAVVFTEPHLADGVSDGSP